MRSWDRLLVSAGWVIAILVSATAIVIASCGGPAGTPSPSEQAATAIAEAEKALSQAELWDSRTGNAVARAVKRETLGADAFNAFASAGTSRAAHLEMAARMGYEDVLAAGRVTYDNGTVMTTAALAGKDAGDIAMLVVGEMPGDSATPDPPDAVFIARPVLENGKLVRVDLTSERGELTLDVATGKVNLADAKYGSCASWNCLAGAVAFWWEDNSTAMDGYWGTAGELCMDCIVLPLSQAVTCPLCAAWIGAPIVASVTNCTVWPCDLCVSDSCHAPEYENQHCVTQNGSSFVRRSVTPWVCENPKTQQSECVQGTTVTEILERCAWGCRPGSPTCQFPLECLVGLQDCPWIWSPGSFCAGAAVVTTYQKQRCVGSGNGQWGTCVPIVGGMESQTMPCAYGCADGKCQPPPTCDSADCERFEKPLGEPSCVVRPDDGRSVIVQQVDHYQCVTVQPRTAVPSSWPEGKTCAPVTETRAVETCPGECTTDGKACAPTCTPSACDATVPGATSCGYDYLRYKRYQRFETKACQPAATGGSSCAVVGDDLREVGLCKWGCTADASDCAPDTGAPEAPGEFIALEGSAPGKTEFMWTDNSLDEQGFRIYHGGCFATPARPCALIATVAAEKMRLLLDWQRPPGSDRCWEIRAFNATGESAPVWYCLPD